MSYTFEEHTADIRMRVTGETFQELFQDALLGMTAAIKPKRASKKENVKRAIALEAMDATSLLIDFLNEALLWMQTNHEAYTGIVFKELTEQKVEAQLEGYQTDEFGEDIKAVTYHEADVKKNANGIWETPIIFDI